MAGNTKDGVAATAAMLARDLWGAEYSTAPKASDAKFMALVAICAMSLSGQEAPVNMEEAIEQLFAKR